MVVDVGDETAAGSCPALASGIGEGLGEILASNSTLSDKVCKPYTEACILCMLGTELVLLPRWWLYGRGP